MKWVLLLLVGAMLAGCSESGDEPVDVGPGRGAITGLLVDDRFRPIQLTDTPTTEFQASGFVLLQETGDQVQTTENGEFSFVDLEPGTYTVRVQADGHEATPQTVRVESEKFTEMSIVARRTLGDNSAVITQEYVIFIGCSMTLLTQLNFNYCDADQSGDSDRSSFDVDYTAVGNVTALVIEMKANQVARYEVDVWWVPDELLDDSEWYASSIFTGDYVRQVLRIGETNTENADFTDNDPWNNTHPFQTDLLVFGLLSEELEGIETGVTGDPNGFLIGGGVGVNLAVEAKFLHSLFLGEPEEDLATYCVLC